MPLDADQKTTTRPEFDDCQNRTGAWRYNSNTRQTSANREAT